MDMDMDIKISKERKAPRMGLSTPRGAEYIDVASVVIIHNNGKAKLEMSFSRYSTENEWYLDFQMSNGLPDFAHGEGSRSCMKKVAKGPLKELIEAEDIDILS